MDDLTVLEKAIIKWVLIYPMLFICFLYVVRFFIYLWSEANADKRAPLKAMGCNHEKNIP